MADNNSYHDLYLGCECMDLDHVVHLIYFDPTDEEKKDGTNDVIYFCVRARNYFNRLCPPILYFWDKIDWDTFLRLNFFRRIWIAFRYILSKNYKREGGILDCFDFRNQDLPILEHFLSLLNDSSPVEIPLSSVKTMSPEIWLSTCDFRLKIQGERIDEDFPYWVAWELQFRSRNIFTRIWHAGRYVFGRYSREQHFEITTDDVLILKDIIAWVQRMNRTNNLIDEGKK